MSDEPLGKKQKTAAYLSDENISRYCDLLGDALLKAAVEHAISKGVTLDPTQLLCDWELTMRQPLEEHCCGDHILVEQELEDIFQAMRGMHEKLEQDK